MWQKKQGHREREHDRRFQHKRPLPPQRAADSSGPHITECSAHRYGGEENGLCTRCDGDADGDSDDDRGGDGGDNGNGGGGDDDKCT